jgi:hypothetical protein
MHTACSSTTLIRTNDSAAKIYLDGELKGKGSVSHSDQKIVGGTTQVMVQKDGCEAKHFQFSRNEETDVGALIGGIFFLIPFLWIMKYKPDHTYEYSCTPERVK